VQALAAELPGVFLGTSNALLAMKHDQEAMGTNGPRAAHGPGGLALLGRLAVDLRTSQYELLRLLAGNLPEVRC